MRRHPSTAVPGDTIDAAEATLAQSGARGLAVVSDGRLAGVFTVSDALRARREGLRTVGDVMSADLQVAYPDEHIHAALVRMTDARISRLPVVERGRPWRLLGMISVRDIAQALEAELMATREAASQRVKSAMEG
jgi:CBS domain-containing protein